MNIISKIERTIYLSRPFRNLCTLLYLELKANYLSI